MFETLALETLYLGQFPLSSQLIKSNYRVMHFFVKCKCGGVTKKAGVSKIYEENV